MAISTPFTVAADAEVYIRGYVTDKVTGAYFEAIEKKNVSTGTVEYQDESGATITLTGDQDFAEEIIHVNLSPSQNINIDDLSGTGFDMTTAPANAQWARLHVWGANVSFAANGDTPDWTSVGRRVQDGGQITLESAAEIAAFQAICDTGDAATIYAAFANRQPWSLA